MFKHEDFSDEDIKEFQDVADDWYYYDIELLGIERVSNYTHLLGAGYLYLYLKKMGKLVAFPATWMGEKWLVGFLL